MICSRCGMEYGVIYNYCNNCGKKLKRTWKIKFFNGEALAKIMSTFFFRPPYAIKSHYKKPHAKIRDKKSIFARGVGYKNFEYLLFIKNLPDFKIYILLLFSVVFSFFTGWICAKYGAGSLFLNRLSFFLYVTGSMLLLAWFILRYFVVYKLLYQSKTNDAVNPALTVFLLMLPFFGFVWHFLVYFKWSLRELDRHDPIVFFLYSLLNVLIFIPGFSVYFVIPYIVADVYVHKIIYSRI